MPATPRPRLRKVTKWCGLAFTILLTIAWIGSGWVTLAWLGRWGDDELASIRCDTGGIAFFKWDAFLIKTSPGAPWGLRFEQANLFRRAPLPISFKPYFTDNYFFFPLWIPLMPLLGITAWSWRLDAHARQAARRNLCPYCKYDRTGLDRHTPCPECGNQPTG